ncbi:hypothetical protein LTR95_011231 [Oleoguttula sp. CCFEE 5521]
MPSSPGQLMFYAWTGSPWASKVVAYLALRGIPYTLCEQPITMPRPDLAVLGLKYRRIPVLAWGRDIYCDSSLIIAKLEKWISGMDYKAIGAGDSTGKALEHLLEKWTDVAVFAPAAGAISSSLELVQDPSFQKDREELWGRPWTKEEQDRLRPAGLVNLRANFDFLEVLLGDGRKWVNGGDGPGLADIHGAWIFSWMLSLPNGLPEDFFSTRDYPKTRAWIKRYDEALAAAQKSAPQPTKIKGADALKKITSADFVSDTELQVEEDPTGLTFEEKVEMFPIDTGSKQRDAGRLVILKKSEMAISTRTQKGDAEVRIHYPRFNFSIGPPATRADGNY